MKVFIDTSTLFKKYVDEPGSAAFSQLLNETDEIIVSPLTRIEMHATLSKYVREKFLSPENLAMMKTEITTDFNFFSSVSWNDDLEIKAVELAQKLSLKTLDVIQLASGLLSKADCFVTSDRQLFNQANKLLSKVRFI